MDNDTKDFMNALTNTDITKLTWATILYKTGTITNDNEISTILFSYMNDGLTEVNARCSLKFPLITPAILNNEIDISTDTQVNNYLAQVLISYCAMCLRKAEGYNDEMNNFFIDFEQRLQTFNSLYRPFVKDEYKRTGEEDTRIQTAKKQNHYLEGWARWKPRI